MGPQISNGLFQKNPNSGWGGERRGEDYFSEIIFYFLDLSLYPKRFLRENDFISRNSANLCDTP